MATPYLGATAAYAAPGDPTVTITSQSTLTASPRNDGTDATVKISANVEYTAATPATPANAPAAVRFTYKPAGGTEVVIGTDPSAPYSVNWNPPAGGGAGYELNATVLNSAGTAAGETATATAKTVTVLDASSVHITSPAEGGSVGYISTTTGTTTTNSIVVSGTRSADLPPIKLYTQIRNNVTGALTPTTVDQAPTAATNGSVGVGVPAAGASQAWSTTVSVPGPIPTNADVVITAVANKEGTSDEVTQAKLVKQTLGSIVVNPPTASVPVGTEQPYTVSVKDTNGAPVAGLPVYGESSNCNFDVNGDCSDIVTTDAAGTAKFVAYGYQPVTNETLTVQTRTAGGYNPANGDLSSTAKFSAYASTPVSAVLSATPRNAQYASQTEYTATKPVVRICATDQNGNPSPNNNGAGNLVVSVTRTATTATGTETTTTPGVVNASAAPNTNCFDVTHQAAPTGPGDFGTDTFNAYYNNNGVAGYQAGTSDIAVSPLTLKFGTLSITALDTQSQKGQAVKVSFKVLGPDGTPFVGRKISLTNTPTATGGFTATQPAGTAAPNAGNNKVIATTDANGVASATVTNTAAGPVTVTATDDITDADQTVPGAQTGTGESTDATVDFRDKSVALATLAQVNVTVIRPGDSAGGSTSYGAANPTVRPGDVLEYTYRLEDANAAGASAPALKNTPVTLTLDRGFFTPACNSATGTDAYSKCTFDPAVADGANVGALKSLGQSLALTSKDDGTITFSVAIGRDAGFDDDGSVLATLTGTSNGVAKAAANKVSFTTNGINPINGGSVKLVPATQEPNYNRMTGDVAGYPGTYFAVHVRDQFGNLMKTPGWNVNVSVTGGNGRVYNNQWGGGGTSVQARGTFLSSDGEVLRVYSDNTSFTGESSTVTATWNAPTRTFTATPVPATATTPASTTYAVAPATTTALTDTFTVNLYKVDTAHLTYAFTSTPGNSVPVNTAVTTSVTVKDQKGNPVADNLCVRFIRSGPDAQTGDTDANGTCRVQTNWAGKAGYSFSSTTPGTATISVIVTDGSGNELGRGVQNVTFTKATPAASKPTFSLATNVISAGQTDRLVVRGTPGQTVEVLAYSLPNTTYKVVRTGTLSSAGTAVFFVAPATNSRIYVRSTAGQAASQHITVKSALTLAASAKGRVGTFTGKVSPAVVGRTVTIYYIKGGKSVAAGSAKVAKGGTYTFSRTFAAPGQKISFFAQTTKDSLNASGRSLTRQITFGR
jgi:adhesin/invasin